MANWALAASQFRGLGSGLRGILGVMSTFKLIRLCCMVWLTLLWDASAVSAAPASRALPERSLLVELRAAPAVGAKGVYAAGAASDQGFDAAGFEPHSVLVKNGGQVSVRLGRRVTLQAVDSVTAPRTARSNDATGQTRPGAGAGFTQTTHVLENGQTLHLRPTWPGGKKMVEVALELQVSALDASGGSAVPAQRRNAVFTTVQVPLDVWLDVASSGAEAYGGVVSSEAAVNQRQAIQLRVTLK